PDNGLRDRHHADRRVVPALKVREYLAVALDEQRRGAAALRVGDEPVERGMRRGRFGSDGTGDEEPHPSLRIRGCHRLQRRHGAPAPSPPPAAPPSCPPAPPPPPPLPGRPGSPPGSGTTSRRTASRSASASWRGPSPLPASPQRRVPPLRASTSRKAHAR